MSHCCTNLLTHEPSWKHRFHLPSNNTASFLGSSARLQSCCLNIRCSEKHAGGINCYSGSASSEDLISWTSWRQRRRRRGNPDTVDSLKSIHTSFPQSSGSSGISLWLQQSCAQHDEYLYVWGVMIPRPALFLNTWNTNGEKSSPAVTLSHCGLSSQHYKLRSSLLFML